MTIEKTAATRCERRDRHNQTRRRFLATSGAVGAALTFPSVATGAGDTRVYKVGLVGCGGRGTGAASQALNADRNTIVYALADAFPEKIDKTLRSLVTKHGERVDVPPSRQFAGLEAYEKLLETDVDIVLLATPPGFRPLHYKACVEAGKNVFVEKPVAVDAPGVRSVLETTELAKKKGIHVLSGLCWRYETHMQDFIKRLQDGLIGEIVNVESTRYNVFTRSVPRREGWTDMEAQVRNWYYYTWLSGDFCAEQFVHELDKVSWLLDEYPTSVMASGGRISRCGDGFGHIYDHFNGIFEYESGRRYFAGTRQHASGSDSLFRDIVFGTKGEADLMQYVARGGVEWMAKDANGRKARRTDMHQLEHDALYQRMRAGEYVNNGQYMAKSSLMGIMMREAAYSGERVTWDAMMASEKKWGDPESIDWSTSTPDWETPSPASYRFS
ncbi:MAG: Gfo/Idh/MocA family oxidoreductase [Verrucomicrobiota bacterium]